MINLVKYLSERLHSDKWTDCKSHLDYMSVKGNQLIFRYFECKRNYKGEFNKQLIKRYANTYEFCNNGLSKFILLLRKGVHPDKYMDIWERFAEVL